VGDVEVRKVWAARATVWIVVEFVVPIRGEAEGETGYLFIFHAIEKSNKAISAEEGRADGKGGEGEGEWGGVHGAVGLLKGICSNEFSHGEEGDDTMLAVLEIVRV